MRFKPLCVSCIISEREVMKPGRGGLVGLGRLDTAVINCEFLEVGQYGKRQLGGPGVAPDLIGGRDFLFELIGNSFFLKPLLRTTRISRLCSKNSS